MKVLPMTFFPKLVSVASVHFVLYFFTCSMYFFMSAGKA